MILYHSPRIKKTDGLPNRNSLFERPHPSIMKITDFLDIVNQTQLNDPLFSAPCSTESNGDFYVAVAIKVQPSVNRAYFHEVEAIKKEDVNSLQNRSADNQLRLVENTSSIKSIFEKLQEVNQAKKLNDPLFSAPCST